MGFGLHCGGAIAGGLGREGLGNLGPSSSLRASLEAWWGPPPLASG